MRRQCALQKEPRSQRTLRGVGEGGTEEITPGLSLKDHSILSSLAQSLVLASLRRGDSPALSSAKTISFSFGKGLA